MAGSSKYSPSHRKRCDSILAKPDTLDIICAHVAEGGTLEDLADTWQVPYGWVLNWLHADEEGRMKRYLDSCSERAAADRDRILQELRILGFADFGDLYDKDGNAIPVKKLPAKIRKTIKKLGKDGYELYDKLAAMKMLGVERGMFTEKVEHQGKLTLEQLVAASHETPKKPETP